MKILKPTSNGKKNDTFYELLDLWESEGLCELERIDDIQYVWVEEPNYILLYDSPTLDTLNCEFQYGLFANEVPEHPNIRPWVFWGRQPSKLEEESKKETKGYHQRNTESIFVGKVENDIQYRRRIYKDWSKGIELFDMPIYKEYRYNQDEYLNLLRDSKYGLCLPGYGYKCNREIEYLALGVVPIMTPDVNLDYYNRLESGVHYISVENPNDIKPLLDEITEQEWEFMSENGRQWYKENSSIVGSFNTTLEIIEKEFKIKLDKDNETILS